MVGEGANLGVTQAGRIAFARAGGRIDTDAIDNSAGVDTSDHEVNIKILTGMEERAGPRSTGPGRDGLLQSMTDEVAAHVLAHNYDQTLALSLMQRHADTDLRAQAEFMAALEPEGRLDRALEGLPDAAGVAALRHAGRGSAGRSSRCFWPTASSTCSDSAIAGAGPGRPLFPGDAAGLLPRPRSSPYAERRCATSAAARDHRHGDLQRHGQPLRPDLPAPALRLRPAATRRR